MSPKEKAVIDAAAAFVDHYNKRSWPFKCGPTGESLGLTLRDAVAALREPWTVEEDKEHIWLKHSWQDGIHHNFAAQVFESRTLAEKICRLLNDAEAACREMP